MYMHLMTVGELLLLYYNVPGYRTRVPGYPRVFHTVSALAEYPYPGYAPADVFPISFLSGRIYYCVFN